MDWIFYQSSYFYWIFYNSYVPWFFVHGEGRMNMKIALFIFHLSSLYVIGLRQPHIHTRIYIHTRATTAFQIFIIREKKNEIKKTEENIVQSELTNRKYRLWIIRLIENVILFYTANIIIEIGRAAANDNTLHCLQWMTWYA